jgi:hypothetical protein
MLMSFGTNKIGSFGAAVPKEPSLVSLLKLKTKTKIVRKIGCYITTSNFVIWTGYFAESG